MIDITNYKEKTPDEIVAIKKSQAITDAVFEKVTKEIRAGVTEIEIARFIENEFSLASAEVAFDTIVAFGENATEPHAVPSDRRLKAGDMIMIDMGAKSDGFCSDMTRTLAYKKVTPRQLHIYNVVLGAQEATIAKLKVGAICEEIHAYCRKFIENIGYGKYFTHGTGHGVGREIHEAPSFARYEKNLPIGMKLEDYKGTPIKANSVVTVEPGIYYKPIFAKKVGVRIEDMLLVTETGVENLTKSPKNLIILD